MSTFNHSLCFFEHDACNFHMSVCRFVKSGSYYLCINGTAHVCNLLRAFVDEQHHQVSLRVVCSNGICDIFHENSLTSLRLCYDKGTLSFSYGREEVYYACAWICGSSVATEVELFFWEEWGEMFERHSIAHFRWVASVNLVYGAKGEIFFIFVWRTHLAVNDISGL